MKQTAEGVMTESELFREVARQFIERPNEISPYLCDVVRGTAETHGAYGVGEAAVRRIKTHIGKDGGYTTAYEDPERDTADFYADPWQREDHPHREPRCLAALWLALEAES